MGETISLLDRYRRRNRPDEPNRHRYPTDEAYREALGEWRARCSWVDATNQGDRVQVEWALAHCEAEGADPILSSQAPRLRRWLSEQYGVSP